MLLLALVGTLPAIAAMRAVARFDRRRPEPRAPLRKLTLLGALATLPCVGLEMLLVPHAERMGPVSGALFRGFAVAALVEEVAKAACLAFFLRRGHVPGRLDAIVDGARVGLGFALGENVLWLLRPGGPMGGAASTATGAFAVLAVRAALTIPLHGVCGAAMGAFVAKRRFDGSGAGLIGGAVVAVVVHGSFDACLFALPWVGEGSVLWAPVLATTPVLIVVFGVRVLRRAAREALVIDRRGVLTRVGSGRSLQ